MSDTAPFVLRVPWGTFGPAGAWWPNPHVKMSAEKQYAENIRNGFLPPAKQ